MDTTTITTPSGYTVEIRNALTYGQSRDVQRLLLGSTAFDVKPGQKTDPTVSLSMTDVYASQDKAMEYLLASVTRPNGEVAADAYVAVMTMPAEDGEAVRDAVDGITNPKASPKTSK